MRPSKLDHVALFVTDPEAVAARILAQLPRALFLRGPDNVELEYIEHKPSFALA